MHHVGVRASRHDPVTRGGAACLVLLVCLGPGTRAATAQTVVPPGAATRQLVVPFDSAGVEPGAFWLAEGSAVILTDELRAIGVPAIAREDRLRAFEGLHVPTVGSLSHATVIRLGQILGAAQVVVGSVGLTDSTVVVRARTIRLDVGRMSPEIVEQGPLDSLFDIYARIARQIAPAATPVSSERDYSPAALERYIKGLLAESPSARIAFLTDAIRLAPAFARPRLALWSVHHGQGDDRQALAAVRDVPAGHRLSREAQFLSTVSLLNLGQYQEAFERLEKLNTASPDSALLNNLGVIQLRRAPGATGRRAVLYFAEAAKMAPDESDLVFNLGYASWLDRDLPAAIASLREAVRRDPADAQAHYVLGAALQASGSASEGAREKELARRLSSDLAEFDARQAGANGVPRGLERVKDEVDVELPASLRVEGVIAAAGQRDQRALAAFHLEAGRRFYQAGRDGEAIADLRRTVDPGALSERGPPAAWQAVPAGGRIPDAIDALKISLWGEDTTAGHLALAEAYLAVRDEAAARAELREVLARDPQNADAKQLQGRLP